ncbi:hypothetical protein TRFO_24598 [Tritrichomonas foetus]|uniref:Right handed beta helix domain-containing protein n=1 Tax=Tritrichomonas foetus TaxID=1144522 RepID=A0A1J4KD09_9EUKA|nr:hypothetical protein TRFO_24598 [Tritrichomonas foetus]|eukprot:OHT07325.1 hypothetical protein TRFO_24598 [Tritrichomonas foetus]
MVFFISFWYFLKIIRADCSILSSQTISNQQLNNELFLNLTSIIDPNCVTITNCIFQNINDASISMESISSINIIECFFQNIAYIHIEHKSFSSFEFYSNCMTDSSDSTNNFIYTKAANSVFQMNSFYQVGSETLLSLSSLSITLSNTNLTGCKARNGISITNPTKFLKFVETTQFGNSINENNNILNGPSDSYVIDKINNMNGDGTFFSVENAGRYIITRVRTRLSSYASDNSYICFAESYIEDFSTVKNLDGTILIECDFCEQTKGTYEIIHLNNQHCKTAFLLITPIPKEKMGTSMLLKIVFSFIGGALIGVIVFLVVMYVIKFSVKCYQNRQDQKQVFDI